MIDKHAVRMLQIHKRITGVVGPKPTNRCWSGAINVLPYNSEIATVRDYSTNNNNNNNLHHNRFYHNQSPSFHCRFESALPFGDVKETPTLVHNTNFSSNTTTSTRPMSTINVAVTDHDEDDDTLTTTASYSSSSSSSTSTPSPSSSSSSTNMEDEYGEMNSEGESYTHPKPFQLESGSVLPNATLRYMTYGTLNDSKSNVLVVCHALTGNASLHSWWSDLLGPGRAFDTDRYFVVCCNILGSCYGSSGPMSVPPPGVGVGGESDDGGGAVYGMEFPDVSVRDTVRLQLHLLKDHLGLSSIKCVVGGSFGGMQTVEYAAQAGVGRIASDKEEKENGDNSGEEEDLPFVRSVIPIACGVQHTAWQIAVSEAQRQAIYADPKWNNGQPDVNDPAVNGLSVARQIGMISYRTSKGYDAKFGRRVVPNDNDDTKGDTPAYGANAKWEVKSYLEYQGQKFLSRFDPITYVKLTEQMDSHDVGRGRGGAAAALQNVRIPALVLGIDSDVLYPLYEQEELADLLPNAELCVVESDAGHDGFLLEQEQVASYITRFLDAHE